MSVRFNSSDSVPFVTTCDFDVFFNAAGVEAVGEREVCALCFIEVGRCTWTSLFGQSDIRPGGHPLALMIVALSLATFAN